jgi:apolipoprotein N-acyltransferase
VQQVNGIGVGLLNCYEAEFAELTRSLALLGAQVVLIPTAADAWAQLSDGRPPINPIPTFRAPCCQPMPLKAAALWLTSTAAERKP